MHCQGSDGLLCQRNEVQYAFIAERKKTYPIDLMCQLLGVKRNGFYRDRKHQGARQSSDDKRDEIIEWRRKIAEQSEFSYGSRRMKKP